MLHSLNFLQFHFGLSPLSLQDFELICQTIPIFLQFMEHVDSWLLWVDLKSELLFDSDVLSELLLSSLGEGLQFLIFVLSNKVFPDGWLEIFEEQQEQTWLDLFVGCRIAQNAGQSLQVNQILLFKLSEFSQQGYDLVQPSFTFCSTVLTARASALYSDISVIKYHRADIEVLRASTIHFNLPSRLAQILLVCICLFSRLEPPTVILNRWILGRSKRWMGDLLGAGYSWTFSADCHRFLFFAEGLFGSAGLGLTLLLGVLDFPESVLFIICFL